MELALQKSSRRTPKPAGTPTRTKQKKLQVAPPEPLIEVNKNDSGALGFGSGKSQGIEATTKKRKLDGVGEARRVVKKPKTTAEMQTEKSVPVKRGRPTKAKSATSAGSHSHTGVVDQSKNLLDDELCSLPSPDNRAIGPVHDVSDSQQAQDNSNGVAIQRKTGKAAKEDFKSTKRMRTIKAGIGKAASAVEEDFSEPRAVVETTEILANSVPKRRHKKRRSVGQYTKKRKMLPVVAEESRLLNLEVTEPTDPRDEMFEAPSGSLERHVTQSEKETKLTQCDIPELGKIGAGLPEPMNKAKTKPRKKRKPIAQTSRPRKVPKEAGNAKVSVPSAMLEDVQDKADRAISAAKTQAKGQARKPLADVTNVTPSLKAKRLGMLQSEVEAPISRSLKWNGHDTAEPKQNQVYKDPLPDMFPASPIQKTKASNGPGSQSLPKSMSMPREAVSSAADTSAREKAVPKGQKPRLVRCAPKSTKPPSPCPGPAISPPIKVEEIMEQQVLAKEADYDVPQPLTKTRGRPRKTPGPDVISMTKSQPKKLKAPTRPRKQPTKTIPAKTYRPIPFYDLGSESDDPLSLSAPYPPEKAPQRS